MKMTCLATSKSLFLNRPLRDLGELGFVNAFPEIKFLGYYQMSLRDTVLDIPLARNLALNGFH